MHVLHYIKRIEELTQLSVALVLKKEKHVTSGDVKSQVLDYFLLISPHKLVGSLDKYFQ
jgi:hypothetical protein